jgi:hypothetical protein
MKQLFFLAVAILLAGTTTIVAQQKLSIKQGSTLQYQVRVHGRELAMYMYIELLSKNKWVVNWSYDDFRNGKFIITKPSLDSAENGYFNEPVNFEELTLPPDYILLMLSRHSFKKITETGAMQYGGEKFVLEKTGTVQQYLLNGGPVNALYIKGASGTSLCVLDDADTPVILKMEGSLNGVDVELTAIQ